jgi:hypothetical protein
MGCTIRIEDRLVRVVEGSEKSSPEKRPSNRGGQICIVINHSSDFAMQSFSPVVYPIRGPSQSSPLHQPKTPKS